SRTRSPSSANGGRLRSPKLILHHLPGGVQRKLAKELDVSWRFESSHPLAAPGHQIFLGHCALRMLQGHHKGLTHLTESLVGYTDNGDLSDRGMFKHEALDLSRIGVEAANNEHVLFTPVDPQPARLVEIAQVAGVQPAVIVDRLRGGLRIVEVALHDTVTANQHFAVLADAHLDVFAGQA